MVLASSLSSQNLWVNILTDDEHRGLHLKVNPDGSETGIYRYNDP